MINPGILIFVTRGNIAFFEPSNNNYTKNLTISEKLVQDLEIVDATALVSLISSFIEKEKFNSRECIILLSESVSFTRDNTFKEDEKKRAFIQDFTDSIPLEFPEVKIFALGEVEKIVAVNSKYHKLLTETLFSKGYQVVAVIPAAIIPEVGASNGITSEIAKKVLDNFENIRLINFIDLSIQQTPIVKSIITTEKPKGNRIYILVGVFVVGLLVLLALLLLRK